MEENKTTPAIDDAKGQSKLDAEAGPVQKFVDTSDASSSIRGEVFSLASVDPALNSKMHLVNNAIDEIGLTPYHWKLFVLNGFGYAVDSLILLIQSVIAQQAVYEFNPGWTRGLTAAVYVGMLTGAIFWGFSADIIGRRIAFNVSLLVCSVFTIIAGASPNWIVLGLFTCLSAFGGGGNLVLDTAVFLEYLPSRHQWLLTFMACWWGVGQIITGFVAWGFLPNFSCSGYDGCTYDNNKGWRYVWYTCGALVFIMSILRITVIRLKETPKFLLGQGRDPEVVELLQWLSTRYNRPCSLTLEQLEACGQLQTTHSLRGGRKINLWLNELLIHLKGLFLTKAIGWSTILIWISWTLIGLAYPLYNVYLPTYLRTRGAEFGVQSNFIYWRNYALSNLCSIFGPVLAAGLCEVKYLGRRGAMVIGALVTMIFFFCYTQVRSEAQNVGFNCAISFWLNVYYGTLYAYTPEVLPSAHRATGNGIAVACNRVMGILSAVVATYANPASSPPIYICAALFIVMAIVATIFPFEPYGRRSA